MPSRFYRVRVADIAYLRALLDAYDGLAALRSLSADRGEVEWLVGDGLEDEADALAERLRGEIGLVPIAAPNDWIPFGAADRFRGNRVEKKAIDKSIPGSDSPKREVE